MAFVDIVWRSVSTSSIDFTKTIPMIATYIEQTEQLTHSLAAHTPVADQSTYAIAVFLMKIAH